MTINHNMTPMQDAILKVIMEIKSISTTNKTQSVTTNVTTPDHNNTSIKPFKPSNRIEIGDS